MTVISFECSVCTNSLICKLVKETGRRSKHQRRDNKGYERLSEISNSIFRGEISSFVWRLTNTFLSVQTGPINRSNPEYCLFVCLDFDLMFVLMMGHEQYQRCCTFSNIDIHDYIIKVNPSSNTVMVVISKTIIIRLCLVIYYLPIYKTEKLSFVFLHQ